MNGEVANLPEPFRSMAAHLAAVKLDKPARGKALKEALAAARAPLWDAMLAARPEDRDELVRALSEVDPDGPPPEAEPNERPATLADIRRIMAESQWLWKGYIPAARIAGIAAFEGIGKTRFAMDLARRLWFALPWPDGQPPTFPPGTKTLWVCADGQQDDLAAAAEAFGMPDEAIVFNTTHDEPYGGTELDALEDRDRLERFIGQVRPGFVFIDTLTNATSYDVCRATENKALMTPLRDIAQRTQTTIIPLLHLSREGHALGRRIKGITRTIIQLDCPDPEQTGRLRLCVAKSFAKKPPALGVTMTDGGNDYDFNPPSAPAPRELGRPPEARDKAERFIRDALARQNDRILTELAAEYVQAKGSKSTFWRAVDAMVEAGELAKDGGTGTGKQAVLHLIDSKPDPAPDRPF
jgi:AAA domain